MSTEAERLNLNQETRECVYFGMKNRRDSTVYDDETGGVTDETVNLSSRPMPRKVERYLQRDNEAKDAVFESFLKAVEKGNVKRVSAFLQSEAIDVNMETIRDRQPVTALQLAAEQNNFDLVKLLLKNGAKLIEKVGHPDKDEDIHISLIRIRRYQAIVNPAYLCQAFVNPLAAAFNLSGELSQLSKQKSTHDVSNCLILEMDEKLQQLASDLLNECRNSDEVLTLLNGRADCTPNSFVSRWLRSPKFQLVELALEKQQKPFIASSHCQHVLRQAWLDGHPMGGLKNSSAIWTLIYTIHCFLVFGVLQPFIAIVYILFPCSAIGNKISSPKNKFVMFLYSNIFFLALAVSVSMTKSVEDKDGTEILDNSVDVHYLLVIALFIFVCGTIWSYVYEMAKVGLGCFLSVPINIMDLLIVFCFFISTLHSLLRLDNASPVQRVFVDNMPAFSIVFANLRVMQCLFPSRTLGPMLLCFVAMGGDVARFLCIFSIVTLSFSVGLYYIYSDPFNQTRNDFSELSTAILALLFAIFGRDNSSELNDTKVLIKIEGGEEAVNKSSNLSGTSNDTLYYDASPLYVIFGTAMYILFSFLVVLILLNICIAMMSDTYTRVQEHIETEWKFVRTMIWVHYIHAQTLAPPFNLIPSLRCLMELFSWCLSGEKTR
ncbi:transient-receptor-potential-like protein [Ptychodera flava]|uniref:transient-receptor-potential-like protein n=1 Tax=Ptychodera flava TaxID=63121 RepID=UPI00396A65F4